MNISGNTILITGGGSGIGRGLAEAFLAEGDNTVIIAGRRQDKLDEVRAAHPAVHTVVLDIGSAGSIKAVAEQLGREFPALNVVIQNAGIMKPEDLQSPDALATAEATVTTNLLGPIRLTHALLPLLLRQPQAAVLTVTSGIAFVPFAGFPTYGATKAGLHSYSQALRYQLQDTPLQVIELIPPATQTELLGPQGVSNPNAMPLAEYIAETMQILKTQPDVTEVVVERVRSRRYAEASGNYDAFFKQYNDAASGRTQK